MNLPIRLRLTIWYSGLLATGLVLFSLIVYLVMANALLANLDTSLRQRAQQVVGETTVRAGHLVLPRAEEESDVPFIPTVAVSATGRVLDGRLPSAARPWLHSHLPVRTRGFTFHTAGDIRLAIRPIGKPGRPVGYILVWQSIESIDAARHSLLLAMLVTGPVLLVVAGFGGFTLARRSLAPVSQITHVASAITATDLHRRVPVAATRDELRELATTFNAMIDRLEAAMDRERRFTGDASHELRSPLAVIRAETTLALERPRSSGEYRRILETIDEQASAMEELIAVLLSLSRAETAVETGLDMVALATLVDEAIGQCLRGTKHPEVTVDARVPSEIMVVGSAALLTRAIRNVVDNALKVSAAGDTIHITAEREGDRAMLIISDEGPGIPLEHQPRIFEPFYQVAPARTPGDSHGLGLAICRRIVTAHHGSVTVSSVPNEGTSFRIELPAAA